MKEEILALVIRL